MYQSVPSKNDENSHSPIASSYQPIKRKPLPQTASFKPPATQIYDDAHVAGVFEMADISTRLEPDDTSHQPLLAHESVRALPYRATSAWSRYNVFTKSGRELLRRKLLSSGPANWTHDVSGDDKDDDVGKGQPGPAKRRAGWRKGTLACCFAVTICIAIELALLIWAMSTSIGGPGSGLLYAGNCGKVKNMAIWLLLPLNIAATILISTSNYVMQITTAPVRSEIDQAHQFAQAIVVYDMCSHLLRSGRGRRMKHTIWWLLVLSSLPIHLLLNSAIYSSVQASNTGVLVLSDGFENDSMWEQCSSDSKRYNSSSFSFACSLMDAYKKGGLQQMSKAQCILQYANGFQTNASSVIVVSETSSSRWYSPPQAHAVPSSYGIACQKRNRSTEYDQIPDTKRYFKFRYTPRIGVVNVTLPFDICNNVTLKDKSEGAEMWHLVKDNSSRIMSTYDSTKGFFFTAADLSFSDPLLNITSVRSVFDAVNYRYWATTQPTGDYLNPSYKDLSQGWDTRSWLCSAEDLKNGARCNPAKLVAGLDWRITPSKIPVTRCYVYPKEERCTLRYSWRILLVTIVCDIVKLLAMIAALKSISSPLLTVGDMIASFLQNPDPCTEHNCLLDDDAARKLITFWANKRYGLDLHLRCMRAEKIEQKIFYHYWKKHDIPHGHPEPTEFDKNAQHWLQNGGPWWAAVEPVASPKMWVSNSKRWFVALSRARWYTFTFLYLGSTLIAIVYLVFGLRSLRSKGVSGLWTVGLTGPDPNALWEGGIMSGVGHITRAAILVNLPQLLFSTLYFVFNALLTTMHTAQEWANFTKHRKALRVSSPRGQQRSTYWLQLPWAYSIPLIVASGSLHWLLGRSIYLVKVETYGYFGERQAAQDFFACGYSPVTTLALIVLLGCMGLALLMLALRKLGTDAPLVLGNSMAISAACHPDPSEKDVALRPLMWGVVKDENGLDTQHCSFSAREVSPVQEGHFYS